MNVNFNTEKSREPSLQPARTYGLQLDGVTLLNLITILRDAEGVYRKYGFEAMGDNAKEVSRKVVAAIKELETQGAHPAPSGPRNEWLSQEELADRWKVSTQTIRRLRKLGKLPIIQLTGALYRFKLEDILRLESEGALPLSAIAPRRILRPASKKTNAK